MTECAKKKTLNKLNQTLKEFCIDTKAHGLSNVVKSKTVIFRLIWILFLTIAVAASVYLLTTSIINYLEYETTTNYNLITEAKSEFPAITICNLNAFNTASNEFVFKYLRAKLEQHNVSFEFTSNISRPIDKLRTILDILKGAVQKEIYFNDYNLTSVYDLGYSLDSMLISCTYNYKPCHENNFIFRRTSYYGNCFTFIDDKFAPTALSGPQSGLVLELFSGKQNLEQFQSDQSGIYVLVHNKSLAPDIRTNGVSVQSGSATYIGVTRVKYSKLGQPYSNCFLESNLNFYSNITIKSYGAYTQKMCMSYMKQMIIYDNCNCFLSSLPVPRIPDKYVCLNESEVKCAELDLFSYFKEDDFVKNCPIECERTDFILNTNSANFPSEFYGKILSYQNSIKQKFNPNVKYKDLSKKANLTLDELRKSILKISVYYHDLSYTLVEENPSVTWDVLLGTIGGQFGFLVGASFLTLLEFTELIFNIIWIMFSYFNKN